MSGIVGILNLDGAPVDVSVLGRMTEYLAFRGPDTQHVQVTTNVGFGHAMLRITEESAHDGQPFTLDGRRWIVADARVHCTHFATVLQSFWAWNFSVQQ